MTAITVDRSGSVVVGGARVGRVERVEFVGPRGGAAVEWVAHSVHLDPAPRFRTRNAAVGAVVEAWSATVESVEPCPCGGAYFDGVCRACGTCSGCDVCAAVEDTEDALPESNGAPLGGVAHAALVALSGETDVFYTPTESGVGDLTAVVWVAGDGGNRNTFRVGVFMSDAGTVFNGMDGGGDFEHLVTDDAGEAVRFMRGHLELEPVGECVVCGEPSDYCQGHGADNYADYVWAAHDADYHGACRASCRTEGARGVLIVSREYDPHTDVCDGDVTYADTFAEWHPDLPLMDAVDYLRAEYLTTDADHNGPEVWTEGDARGERVDYRTGVVTETEGYLHGYTDGECAVIAALATGDTWACGDMRVTGMGHRIITECAKDHTEAIPLTVGDPLHLRDLQATRKAFGPAIAEADPDRVTGLMDGACATSAFDGYGALYDHNDDTWSVLHMSW